MNCIYEEKIFVGSSSKSIFRLMTFIINWWRTIPCQILYAFSSRKNLIISDFGSYSNMVRTLVFAKHNRNLFYHRIGRKSILFSWILPGDKSIKLPFSCSLGKHVHFVHNDSCHLNAKSIGDNFICYPHVVIGAKNLHCSEKPIIGNNVTIGTGAVIVGKIVIGDNVQIGANSFINQNVPDNCIVIGNPARIVKINNQKVNIEL